MEDSTYGTRRNVVSGNGTKYGWSERLFGDPFLNFFYKIKFLSDMIKL